jgi:hypothetical protein
VDAVKEREVFLGGAEIEYFRVRNMSAEGDTILLFVGVMLTF